MIFDKIKNRSFYTTDPDLARILEFLADFKPEDYPAARVVLDGDKLYVNPVQLTSKPESEGIFEAHRNYADVYFIVEGSEKIVVTDAANLTNNKPYDAEQDYELGSSEQGTSILLQPGDFLVCYPQDAHMVGIAPGDPAPVKKLVGKIKVNLD